MAITEPLSLPSNVGVRISIFRPRRVTAISESPFTLDQQVHVHPGTRWEARIDLPPMSRAQARLWRVFLLSCDGSRRRFLMGDPDVTAPFGTGNGTIVLDGAHSARAETVSLRGLAAEAGVLLAGDYIGLGSGTSTRMHTVLEDANGNGSPSGEASVAIWPPLRTAYSDGAAVTVSAVKGVWRLAGGMEWAADQAGVHQIALDAVEAL